MPRRIGIAGSSGAETTGRWSATPTERCPILDLGPLRLRAAIGAGLDFLAQIEERGPRHLRGLAVVALLSATVSRPGFGQGTAVLEQNAEIECRARVAAFVGAPERRLSLGQRPMLCEQHAELYGGGIVATIGRTTVRGCGLIECPIPPEHHREAERTVSIATRIGPKVRHLGLGQGTPLLQQNTENEGRNRFAAFIGAAHKHRVSRAKPALRARPKQFSHAD